LCSSGKTKVMYSNNTVLSRIVKIPVKMQNVSVFHHYDLLLKQQQPRLSLNNSLLNVEECLQRMDEETTSNIIIYVMISFLLFCIIFQFLYSCYLHRLFKKSQIRYNSLTLNTCGVYKPTTVKHEEEIALV